MKKIDRLEDVTPEWRAYFAAKLAATARESIRLRVAALLPERVDVADPVLARKINDAIRDARRDSVRESVVPACLGWLRDHGYWRSAEGRETRALNEIGGNVDGLAEVELRLPAPVLKVQNSAWVVPAAVGAALGAIALALLSNLVGGGREIGLFVGGVLGAAGLVALVGAAASMPDVTRGLETGLKWVGFIALPLGFWRGIRGRPTGLLRAAVYTVASWLLLGTVRPRTVLPSRAEVLAALDDQLGGVLIHDADLVLAWCWAHPDRLGITTTATPAAEPLSSSICDALGTLRAILVDKSSDPEDISAAAEALLQRVHEDGYEWRSVASGSPYDAAVGCLFAKYGMIEVGQPVETLKPAIVRNGVAVQQGVVRRVRV
jgi:hypothetical protein